jgi:hypothetical protein
MQTAVVFDGRKEYLNPQQPLAIAIKLRKEGIPVTTFFSGALKSQMKKVSGLQCVVIVFPDEIVVKDLWTGRQKQVEESAVLEEVREVLLNGYYDPDESFEDFLTRLGITDSK